MFRRIFFALRRRLLRLYQNIYLFFAKKSLLKKFTNHSGKKHGLPKRLIVSLTSYPPRFGTLYFTLVSLIVQSIKPDDIILWVAYNDKYLLPDNVLNLARQGFLKIETCDDLMSYKKIIPTVSQYPDAFIVTVDDDVFYPSDCLKTLVENWSGAKKEIVSHRAHEITFDSSGKPLPYDDWNHKVKNRLHSSNIFPTGAGGVLYPPHVFHNDILKEDKFMALCPRADDIWLYWMGRLNNATYKVTNYGGEVMNWKESQKTSLLNFNVTENGNDKQIKALNKEYPIF